MVLYQAYHPTICVLVKTSIIEGDKHEYRRDATTYLSQHISIFRKAPYASIQRVTTQSPPGLGETQPNAGSAQINVRLPGTWPSATSSHYDRDEPRFIGR